MDSDGLIASDDSVVDLKEIVRRYGGEEGLLVDIVLGDAPTWLVEFAWLGPAVPGMEMLRELSAEAEALRDVDGDLDRLVDHLRVADPAAPERGLLDALRTHCNSATVGAPRDMEKEAHEIGLLGQDLMRDIRGGFATERAPEFVGRAGALRLLIADFLTNSTIMVRLASNSK